MITTAHILVTSLCDRDCKYCCNKQYDLNDIPYISDDELRRMKHIYLTGGEPFLYSNPCAIAGKLKVKYDNIESVVVYTNAAELMRYIINNGNKFPFIDGLTISIKSLKDKEAFESYILYNDIICKMPNNRLYVFPPRF